VTTIEEVDRAEREHPFWSPIFAFGVLLIPAAIGFLSGQLLLFPSLGPIAVMQAHLPRHRSSRFYNIVVSHLVGLAAADLFVVLFGLTTAPSVFYVHHLSGARVAAALLALLVGTAAELMLRASHPPAAATTLLAALGSFRPTAHDTAWVVVGVLMVAFVGDLGRRLRMRYRLGT
jgi:HPP family protein